MRHLDNFTHHQVEQRSEEWHELRIGRFSASSISKLLFTKDLTKTALDYIYTKAAETLYQFVEDSAPTMAMQWGIDHEDMAVEAYAYVTGNFCDVCGVFANEHLAASPDRLVGASGLIEVKCPFTPKTHLKYLELNSWEDLKSVQPDYYWQIQFQLYATSRQWCDFVSFDPRAPKQYRVKRLRIERNEDDLKRLFECVDVAIEKKIAIIKGL